MYIQADQNGIKNIPGTKSWRLIHNDGKVMEFAEKEVAGKAGGTTEVFIAATKDECKAEIVRLGLELPDPLKEDA